MSDTKPEPVDMRIPVTIERAAANPNVMKFARTHGWVLDDEESKRVLWNVPVIVEPLRNCGGSWLCDCGDKADDQRTT